MSRKAIAIALAAVVAVASVVAFTVTANDGNERDSRATASPTVPGMPTLSPPSEHENAQMVVEINNIIAEVTKEALERPRDERMTAEEINALIQSRIEELKARYETKETQ